MLHVFCFNVCVCVCTSDLQSNMRKMSFATLEFLHMNPLCLLFSSLFFLSCSCCCCLVCVFSVSFRSSCYIFPHFIRFSLFCTVCLSFVRSHYDCNILSIYEGKAISLLAVPMSSVVELRSHPLHSLAYSRSLSHALCLFAASTLVCMCVCVCLITIANDPFTCKKCSSTFAVTVTFVVFIFDDFLFAISFFDE